MTQAVTRFARQEMAKWGLIEEGWVFVINGRLHRSLGRCIVKKSRRTGEYVERKIEVSRKYVEAHGLDDLVKDTILHEIAHALAGLNAGHGPCWKAWAVKVGARPVTCKQADQMKFDAGPTWRWAWVLTDPNTGERRAVKRFQKRPRKDCARMWLTGRPETKGCITLVKLA